MLATARLPLLAALGAPIILLTSACGKKTHDHDHASAAAAPAKHEHVAPHGGTAVELGEEVYHLELVRDPARGVLQAFMLDGELENFIRSAAPSFEVVATVGDEKRTLLFKPVTDAATGEKPGDASLFEAQADWLKTTAAFSAVLVSIDIRGTTFADVAFKFPEGETH